MRYKATPQNVLTAEAVGRVVRDLSDYTPMSDQAFYASMLPLSERRVYICASCISLARASEAIENGVAFDGPPSPTRRGEQCCSCGALMFER